AIMNKIQSRDYTTKEKGTLKPTELGKIIAQMLETNFKIIMDIGFTAAMEDELESVAEDKKNWKELLQEFWSVFAPLVTFAEKDAFVPKVETDKLCPSCQKPLQKIWAKGRYFYGCSDYPTCSYTAPLEALEFKKEDYDPNFCWEQPCPKCGKSTSLRFGKFGPFLGCSDYPTCKGIINIPKKGEAPPAIMPSCPAISCTGTLVARRSRFGKTFYSCSEYPECDVIVNNLDQLVEKYAHHPKTPYVAKKKSSKQGKSPAKEKKTPTKKTPTKKKTRVASTYTLSPELAAIVGEKTLPRAEVLKKIWDYIKAHDCQDPSNKRLIRPDALLEKLFGSKEPLNMMKLPGIISKHLQS
ncbi:MAG: DNA topoisomerase I, partial [Chlamydiae bacterium]|nr:DNA topoisomerase I [Chlamydiota bacterium]